MPGEERSPRSPGDHEDYSSVKAHPIGLIRIRDL